MTHATVTPGSAATPFAAPSSPADLVADALGRIVTGRPLPAALQPPAVAPRPAPRTVAEGIAAILAGPAATAPRAASAPPAQPA